MKLKDIHEKHLSLSCMKAGKQGSADAQVGLMYAELCFLLCLSQLSQTQLSFCLPVYTRIHLSMHSVYVYTPIHLYARTYIHYLFAPEITKNDRFRLWKNGTLDAWLKKTETAFYRQPCLNLMDLTLVWCKYHFQASFGQIWKIDDFRLSLCWFPKNQNPLATSVNFGYKSLIFDIQFPYT